MIRVWGLSDHGAAFPRAVLWMAFGTREEAIERRRTAHSSWPPHVVCVDTDDAHTFKDLRGREQQACRVIERASWR